MDKKEVSLDDLFNGDNFYGKQMQLEYEAWKEMNVDADEDITQEDYQIAILNTRAFGYESIRDTQENKEFWVNIAALVVIVGVALVFPPAGIALGAAYGVAELSSAVSGKDWVSGRELGTGERWFRGALAPLDIIPGAMAVKKFSGVARTVSFADDLGQLGKTTSLTNKAQSSIQKVNDFALTAKKQATARLKHVDALIMEREAKILAKLADGAIGTARVVDETVVNTKNFVSDIMPDFGWALVEGEAKLSATNTHTVENAVKKVVNRIEGLNIKGSGVPNKGTNNLDEVPKIDEIAVNFNYKTKFDSEEFARQLKDQEKGMNGLTVDEYLKNRERYIAQGRAIEGNAYQQAARERALRDKIDELVEQGCTLKEAKVQANKWMGNQAALHNPDQVAGGFAANIGGVGDTRINSSLGSQWRYRIDALDEKIQKISLNMNEEQLKNTYLNIKLTH